MSSNPIGSNWTYPLGKTVVTASQVGVPISVPLGGSFQQSVWIEASNETPYILSIFSAQGILLNQIQPQLQDIAQIPSGDSSFILVASLLLPQAAPSSEVDINVYPFGKPTGAYPIPLGRQAAPTSASSSGFTLSSQVSGTNSFCLLNFFNPLNSGKIATLYLAKCILSVSANVNSIAIELDYFIGANINLSQSLTPIPNDTASVSVMLGSRATQASFPGITNRWEQDVISILSGTSFIEEIVHFPAQRKIPPGVNCLLGISNLTVNGQAIMVMEWQEN